MHTFLIADQIIVATHDDPGTLRNVSHSRNLLTFCCPDHKSVGARI